MNKLIPLVVSVVLFAIPVLATESGQENKDQAPAANSSDLGSAPEAPNQSNTIQATNNSDEWVCVDGQCSRTTFGQRMFARRNARSANGSAGSAGGFGSAGGYGSSGGVARSQGSSGGYGSAGGTHVSRATNSGCNCCENCTGQPGCACGCPSCGCNDQPVQSVNRTNRVRRARVLRPAGWFTGRKLGRCLNGQRG